MAKTAAPPASKMPVKQESDILVEVHGQLHLFDAAEGVFMLQDDNVTASVVETGRWECT